MYTEKILDQTLSKENLNQTYKKVKSNKGVAGVDGMTVEELERYLVKRQD